MGVRLALSSSPLPNSHKIPAVTLRAADRMRHHDDDPANHDDVDHDHRDCADRGDDLRGSLGGVLCSHLDLVAGSLLAALD